MQLDPVLLARFEPLRRLGTGGQATVVLAVERATGRRVALKRMGEASPAARERLRREARALASVVHPHLVAFLDVIPGIEPPVLVMEALEGTELTTLIRAAGPAGLPPDEVRLLGARLASALAMLHAKGFVHRDVKPANVVFVPERGPVLVDLGVVRDGTMPALSAGGAVLGTFAYLAPEVLRGAPAGPEADVFALGLVLAEALEGELPFTPDEIHGMALGRRPDGEVARRLGQALGATAAGAISPDPAARPGAAELERALARGTEVVGPKIQAAPGPVAQAVPRPADRPARGRGRPALFALAAASLAAALLVGGPRAAPDPPLASHGPAGGELGDPPQELAGLRAELERAGAGLVGPHPLSSRIHSFSFVYVEVRDTGLDVHPEPYATVLEPGAIDAWEAFASALGAYLRGVERWGAGRGLVPEAFDHREVVPVLDRFLHGVAVHVLEDFYLETSRAWLELGEGLSDGGLGSLVVQTDAGRRAGERFKAAGEILLGRIPRPPEGLPDGLAPFPTLARALLGEAGGGTPEEFDFLARRLYVRRGTRVGYWLARALLYLVGPAGWTKAGLSWKDRRSRLDWIEDAVLPTVDWTPGGDRLDLVGRCLVEEARLARLAGPDDPALAPDRHRFDRLMELVEPAARADPGRLGPAIAMAVHVLARADRPVYSAVRPPPGTEAWLARLRALHP